MNSMELINGPAVLDSIRTTLQQQSEALTSQASHLDETEFLHAVQLLYQCRGHIVVCGMGKSGHIGKKMAATFASTGSPSFFLHPAEAFHGDLGMITPRDVVLLISNSGETDEILKLIPSLTSFGNKIISITNDPASTLAKNTDVALQLVMENESCPNNLAPTTSSTLTLAIGDALAIALMKLHNFQPQDFARYHPGGSLGRRLLTRVKDVMQPNVPTVHLRASFREVITEITSGCQGMVIVTDSNNHLQGIVTDGDLRRTMESSSHFLDSQAEQMMTRRPITIPSETKLATAQDLMAQKRISTLLISDDEQTVLGLIRVYN